MRSAAAMVSLLLAGCYTYTPLATLEPVQGTQVVLVLSDQGRVGMAPSIGPAIARVEGAIASSSDSAYLLRVSDVVGINGRRNPWAGESVAVRRTYVVNTLERRFSRSRTGIVAAGATVALVAFILTRNLLGLGGEGVNGPPGGPPNGQ